MNYERDVNMIHFSGSSSLLIGFSKSPQTGAHTRTPSILRWPTSAEWFWSESERPMTKQVYNCDDFIRAQDQTDDQSASNKPCASELRQSCFLLLPVARSLCYRAYLNSVRFVLHRRFCYRAYLISVSFVVDCRLCYKTYLISVSFVVDRRKGLQC